jgi:hypothetical protein
MAADRLPIVLAAAGARPEWAANRAALVRGVGFDPAAVQAVILTPTSAVAVDSDYPEPYIPPQEA